MNLIRKEENRLPALYIIIPILIALGIRITFYFSWTNSTFKYYSFVKGLDMQTLLKWGIDFAVKGEMANNLYVYIISVIVKLTNGSIFTINTIIIFQLILGIGTVLLSVYIAWLIFGSKAAACISGVLIACYAPLLMYEGFILKNTICTFLTTGLFFTALLFYEKAEYKNISALCSGFFAGMILFANFASLCFVLFVYLWQILIIFKTKGNFKSLLIYPATILIIFIVLFASTEFRFFPVVNNIADGRWLSYVAHIGAQREIKTLNESVQTLENQPFSKTIDIYPYLKKTFSLLSSAEVPDNINYYFVKDGLTPLGNMLSPFLLYAIGIPAFFLYLVLCRDRKVSLMFGMSFASLALPLIIFVPLSRYTIVYSPLLGIFSAWLICEFAKRVRQKNKKIVLFIILLLSASFVIQTKLNPVLFYRASDFVAFANALEIKNPGDLRIPYAYGEAYKVDPESVPISLKYTDVLMNEGRFLEASNILEKLHSSNQSDTIITLQLSSAFLGCNKTHEAGVLLDNLSRTPIHDDTLYLYNKAEYLFQTEKYKEALTLYEKLKLLNIQAIKEKISKRILFIKAQNSNF